MLKYAALNGDASELGGGPCEAEVQPAGVARGEAGHAVALVQIDRDHGDVCLKEGLEGTHPFAESTIPLGVEADHESGDVYEVDHWDVEGVAELYEAGLLLGARAVESAAEVHGIVGENADGVASETGEAANEGRGTVAAYFEEGAAVGDDFNNVPHVVGGFWVLGHDFEEDLVLAAGGSSEGT